MAMQPCPECHSLMSDRAPTCLNCGYPIAADNGPSMNEGYTATGRGWQGLALYGTFASVLMLIAITLWRL